MSLPYELRELVYHHLFHLRPKTVKHRNNWARPSIDAPLYLINHQIHKEMCAVLARSRPACVSINLITPPTRALLTRIALGMGPTVCPKLGFLFISQHSAHPATLTAVMEVIILFLHFGHCLFYPKRRLTTISFFFGNLVDNAGNRSGNTPLEINCSYPKTGGLSFNIRGFQAKQATSIFREAWTGYSEFAEWGDK